MKLCFLGLNYSDYFILMWVLYYLQGILYPMGSIVSLVLLGVNLLVSISCAFKVLQMRDTPVYFKGFNVLMLMFTIYGIFYILFNPSTIYYPRFGESIQSYNYLKSIYLSLLPIYPFYYYAKKGYLTEKKLQRWGVVFLISVTLVYFQYQQNALQELMEKGSSREEITNNTGYLFLSCIPLLVLYRKVPFIQFSALAFLMAFIVMGMKRGAIVIGAVVSVYFMLSAIKNSRGKTRFVFFLFSIVICIVSVYFVIYQMENSDYMMARIQDTLDGDSSGRDNIYSFFWTYFIERTDALQFFIGRGGNGTLEIYKNYAHNDWLEIAVNQGLLGIIVYTIYWVCFYKTWKQTSNIDAKNILAIIMLIYFAKTLFSMSYGDMTYVATSVLGYSLARSCKSDCCFGENSH